MDPLRPERGHKWENVELLICGRGEATATSICFEARFSRRLYPGSDDGAAGLSRLLAPPRAR